MKCPSLVLVVCSIGVLLVGCTPRAEADAASVEKSARENREKLETKSAERMKQLEAELAHAKGEIDTLKAAVTTINSQRKDAARANDQSLRDELKRALIRTGARLSTGLTFDEFRVAWSELQATIATAKPALSPAEREALEVVVDTYRTAFGFWERSIQMVYSGGANYRYRMPVNEKELAILREIAPSALISGTENASPQLANAAFIDGCRISSRMYVEQVLDAH